MSGLFLVREDFSVNQLILLEKYFFLETSQRVSFVKPSPTIQWETIWGDSDGKDQTMGYKS